MATERTRRRTRRCATGVAGLAAATCLLLAPLTVRAQAAAEPWWVPLAFAGQTVSSVRVENGQIAVDVSGGPQKQSSDGGRTWQPTFERHGITRAPQQGVWQVRDGRVGRLDAGGAWHLDPGSPHVDVAATAGHASVAAVPGADGLVVAVDVDGVVWRRDAQGHWDRALLLLNQDALHGPPRITGIAAFTAPLTSAVYLATDGYSVLESSDGGEDWVRANPGLPDGVLAIATDDARRAVYAATADGLWVHHLQPTPAPPVYSPQNLTWRWLATAAVSVAAAGAALGGMMKLTR